MRHQRLHEMVEVGDYKRVKDEIKNLSTGDRLIIENELNEKLADYKMIKENLEKLEDLETNNPYHQLGYLCQSASLEFRMGNIKNAIDHFEGLFDQIGSNDYDVDDTAYWNLQGKNVLGCIRIMEGDLVNAKNELMTSVDIAETSDFDVKLAPIYSNLGVNELYSGNYQEAIKFYNKALQIYKKYEIDRYIGTTTANLAQVYTILGNLEKAESLLTESIEILKLINAFDGLTDALTKLAEIKFLNANYDESLKLLRSALDGLTKTHNPYFLSFIYYNFILIYMNRDLPEDTQRIKFYLEKFESLLAKNNPPIIEFRYKISQYAHKLHMGELNRLRDEFQNIYDNSPDNEIRLLSLYYLCLTIIEELKESDQINENLVDLVKTKTTLIKKIGEEINSEIILIRGLVLESQINLIQLNISEAFDQMDLAIQRSKDNNFKYLADEINQIKENLRKIATRRQFLESMKFNNRIQESLLEFYLNKLINTNVSQ